MSSLNRMNIFNLHRFTSKRKFDSLGKIEKQYLNASYKFAYRMSFTEEGHHRRNRSGGNEKRKQVQIFCDAFNGKLGEFAVYQYFLSKGIQLNYPDVNIMGEGEWDSYDFNINGIKIGVKTTKQKGQLLLLETKDWNNKGQYIPNLKKGHGDYDYIILVRIDSNIIEDLKKQKLYYKDNIGKKKLAEIVKKSSYNFDIAGYVDKNMLINAITNKFIIKQDDYLQSESTKMDAENYYIQAGDMYHINSLMKHLLSAK
ncbi:hypothetical protein PB1_02670 [Bacillus methanolicus PB1]|uniref:Uncharacterized protein n=1 Tax=Bacillus methanolicus PB1 TaxID=997296 RepID=I3E5N6_BACMT|nr:hypothetical protein [Bacillus methanolicus]EIJ81807.1 hypothetical protein PB1_02670 [Bacillus methanolicus PB1]